MSDVELQLIRECLDSLALEGKLPADISSHHVERKASLDSLGIDSLGKVEFLLELEKRSEGAWLSERAEEFETFGDLCVLLQAGNSNGNGAATVRHIDSREGSLSDYARVRSPDLFAKVNEFAYFLEDLRERGDEKYLLPVRRYQGSRAVVDLGYGAGEKEVIVYCSANYLGLSFHPRVLHAVHEAVSEFGASVASVPLIAGSTSLHSELQKQLASFLGVEDVVLFPTGHAANVGTIAALAGPRDLVVLDKQVHYSILEGVRLAGASWVSFRHSDPEDLEKVLISGREGRGDSGILVILEGVYGIDGDVAPLPELMRIAHAHGARVMVDDAHATGVLGERGRGTREHYRIETPPDLVMGSLSKSLGSMGGWIATNKETADYLRYFAKTIVFSVGLPAINAAAAMAALDLIEQEPRRLFELRQNVQRLKDGLMDLGLSNVRKSDSSILSVIIGDERTLRDVVRDLFEEGVWVEGLPFPAVTRGQERVRFRVSTLHTEEDIEQTVESVDKVFRKHGLLKTRFSSAGAQQASIVQLARDSARARGLALPWLTGDFYERIVAQSGHWASARESQWFVNKKKGEPVAACMASMSQVYLEGELTEVGFIGHVHWVAEADAALESVLSDAVAWLGEDSPLPVFAPLQAPLQILGGGLVRQGDPSRGPFLEPATSPDCYRALDRLGFRGHSAHVYRRVSIRSALAALGDVPEADGPQIRFRPLDRARLKDEVRALLDPFNASIGRAELCSPVDFELFYGVARDLRELILPELWQMAEIDGRIVGFVGAFPDVNEGFLQAGGSAGVADLDFLKDLVDRAERGFLAWLAVEPEYHDLQLGKRLLQRVYGEMEGKGYQETLLSWEMRDGALTEDDLSPADTHVADRIEYEIYRR